MTTTVEVKTVEVKTRLYEDDAYIASRIAGVLGMSRSELIARLVYDGMRTLEWSTMNERDRKNLEGIRRRMG